MKDSIGHICPFVKDSSVVGIGRMGERWWALCVVMLSSSGRPRMHCQPDGISRSFSQDREGFLRPRRFSLLNDTADYYRFFDATAQAEFLYRCVSETVKHDLPEEVAYLEAYDRFVERVQQIVDMPSDTVDLLHRFLRQNEGALSQRARTKEFGALTPDEVREIEQIHNECFK
jgi:hypothetical protein